MAIDKRTLVNIGAAAVAAIALGFAVSQCNGNKRNMEEVGAVMADAKNMLDSLSRDNSRLNREIVIRDGTIVNKNDTIRVLRDSIVVLNDSLDVVNGKLKDCQDSKKDCKDCNKKTVVKKPVAKKPTPVKPAPRKPAPVKVVAADTVVAATGCGKDENVVANHTSGTTNVNVNGDNNCTNVNNGVVINNYYGDKQKCAEEAQKCVDAAKQKTVTVVVKRTRIYEY